MDRFEKIDVIYKLVVAILPGVCITIILTGVVVGMLAVIPFELQKCNNTYCFGINLSLLIPDYGSNIASIADELQKQVQADNQALSKQLFEIYQELVALKATVDRFKVLLPNSL